MLKPKIIFYCFLLALAHVFSDNVADTISNKTQIPIFCYFNGSDGLINSLSNSELDASLCTYVLIHGTVDQASWTIKLARTNWEETILNDMDKLKAGNNNLKFIISIDKFRQTNYFPLLAYKHKRKFATNAKLFIRKYKFDGIHIDWQYPGLHSPVYDEDDEEDDSASYTLKPTSGDYSENDTVIYEDNYDKDKEGDEHDENDEDDEDDEVPGTEDESPGKKYFLNLIKELKSQLSEDGTLIAVSIGAHQKNLSANYDLANLRDIIDYWFIMAMRYNLRYKSKILQDAPIRTSNSSLGVKATVELVKKSIGPDHNKLVLAIPFYGMVHRLRSRLKNNQNPFENKIKSRAAITPAVTYSAVCSFVEKVKKNNVTWTYKYNTTAEAPYIVSRKTVILYEDSQSVQAKTIFAINEGLGGIMAFNLDADDAKGSCSCQEKIKYPLLKTIYDTIHSPSSEKWKDYQPCL